MTRHMRKLRTIGPVALLLGLAVAPAAQAACRTVAGTIDASVVGTDPVTVVGNVTGDLAGSTRAVVSAMEPNEDGTMQIALAHDFVTSNRATIRTEDEAVWTPIAGRDGVFHMATEYRITGGSGAFEGATGKLFNDGIADTTNGLVTLRYTGEICGN